MSSLLKQREDGGDDLLERQTSIIANFSVAPPTLTETIKTQKWNITAPPDWATDNIIENESRRNPIAIHLLVVYLCIRLLAVEMAPLRLLLTDNKVPRHSRRAKRPLLRNRPASWLGGLASLKANGQLLATINFQGKRSCSIFRSFNFL